MSGIFEPVVLRWGDKEYTVSPDKVMGLIEVIEDSVTIEELQMKNGVKRAKLAKAYASALKYAGCDDAPQERIYNALFGPDAAVTFSAAIAGVLALMIPPEHIRSAELGKLNPPKRKKAGDAR